MQDDTDKEPMMMIVEKLTNQEKNVAVSVVQTQDGWFEVCLQDLFSREWSRAVPFRTLSAAMDHARAWVANP